MDSRYADALAAAMNRLYERGLTTISGGNLSLTDERGVMWITPGGVDKGNLTGDDIIAVHPDGSIAGKHRPSLETAFHRRIYDVRDDVHAVVHAHAPWAGSFCITQVPPDTRCIPQVLLECGEAVMSGYEMPGSVQLAEAIARQAAGGSNVILLDNHGTLSLGSTLQQALQRFEAVDACAAALCYGRLTGMAIDVPEPEVRKLILRNSLPAQVTQDVHAIFSEACAEVVRTCSRAYKRGLMTSTLGSCSVRTDADAFIITPQGHDRLALETSQLVHIRKGEAFGLAEPDIWHTLHRAVYRACPEVRALVLSSAPTVMAYAVTNTRHDTRTLTEGYMILGTISNIPLERALAEPDALASLVTRKTPGVLISHCGLMASGETALQALDRIEVAETGMRAELWARQAGICKALDDNEIEALEKRFRQR